jgi:hypothetical protein
MQSTGCGKKPEYIENIIAGVDNDQRQKNKNQHFAQKDLILANV